MSFADPHRNVCVNSANFQQRWHFPDFARSLRELRVIVRQLPAKLAGTEIPSSFMKLRAKDSQTSPTTHESFANFARSLRRLVHYAHSQPENQCKFLLEEELLKFGELGTNCVRSAWQFTQSPAKSCEMGHFTVLRQSSQFFSVALDSSYHLCNFLYLGQVMTASKSARWSFLRSKKSSLHEHFTRILHQCEHCISSKPLHDVLSIHSERVGLVQVPPLLAYSINIGLAYLEAILMFTNVFALEYLRWFEGNCNVDVLIVRDHELCDCCYDKAVLLGDTVGRKYMCNELP